MNTLGKLLIIAAAASAVAALAVAVRDDGAARFEGGGIESYDFAERGEAAFAPAAGEGADLASAEAAARLAVRASGPVPAGVTGARGGGRPAQARVSTLEERRLAASDLLQTLRARAPESTARWIEDLVESTERLDEESYRGAMQSLDLSAPQTQRFLLSALVERDGVAEEVRTDAARIIAIEARGGELDLVITILKRDGSGEGVRFAIALGLATSGATEARAALAEWAGAQRNPALRILLESAGSPRKRGRAR